MAGMLVKDQVAALSTMTTHDEAGRHFTVRYPDETLAWLEEAGFIEVTRPIHDPTGISWDESHWSVEVTPAGVELVEAWPEYQVGPNG